MGVSTYRGKGMYVYLRTGVRVCVSTYRGKSMYRGRGKGMFIYV